MIEIRHQKTSLASQLVVIPGNRGHWEAAVELIGGKLSEKARITKSGVSWLVDERLCPALGPHLHGGSTGISMFFAAHYCTAGKPRDRELALALVAPLRLKLKQLADDPKRAAMLRLGIGGLVGVGSFLYALTRLAKWLREPELLNDASLCLSLLTEERIGSDDQLDVVSGAAGTILALLAFERELSPSRMNGIRRTALGVAEACAEHLLATRLIQRGRSLGWPGPEGRPPISGFAHGAAGIAYSLLCLYRRIGGRQYATVAQEAYAFERSLYLPDEDGWFDPCFNRPVQQCAWCHGTPGIALGRVGGLDIISDTETRTEVQRMLHTLLALPPMFRDHLCCGNASRIEIFHTIAKALGNEELSLAAGQLANQVLRRAGRAGDLRLKISEKDEQSEGFSPSLFLGSAGVGYVFLRLVYPEVLPCLLLMD